MNKVNKKQWHARTLCLSTHPSMTRVVLTTIYPYIVRPRWCVLMELPCQAVTSDESGSAPRPILYLNRNFCRSPMFCSGKMFVDIFFSVPPQCCMMCFSWPLAEFFVGKCEAFESHILLCFNLKKRSRGRKWLISAGWKLWWMVKIATLPLNCGDWLNLRRSCKLQHH